MTFKNQKPKATTTPNSQPMEADKELSKRLKSLDQRISKTKDELKTLADKCKLAAIAVDAAMHGLAMPSNLSNSLDAYAWLTEAKQRIAGQRHTTTPQQLAAASEIRATHLQPLEDERSKTESALKADEDERRKLKTEIESTMAPQLIADHIQKLALLKASKKLKDANTARLNKEAVHLQMSLTELAAQELETDDKLAQAIESGTELNDVELVQIQAKRIATSKRLDLTKKAAQKALEAAKHEGNTIAMHEGEITRLRAVESASKISKRLNDFVQTLTNDGHAKADIVRILSQYA